MSKSTFTEGQRVKIDPKYFDPNLDLDELARALVKPKREGINVEGAAAFDAVTAMHPLREEVLTEQSVGTVRWEADDDWISVGFGTDREGKSISYCFPAFMLLALETEGEPDEAEAAVS